MRPRATNKRFAEIRILVVVDGQIRFKKHYFGLSSFLKNLRKMHKSEWWAKAKITLAHREGSAELGAFFSKHYEVCCTPFRFSHLDDYDVIFLFGYNSNEPDLGDSTNESSELFHLHQWMDEKQGGIFACGDHGHIGRQLCGSIKRVKDMQKWNDPEPPIRPSAINSLQGGRDVEDTRFVDESQIREKTDQSDDIPKRLRLIPSINHAFIIPDNEGLPLDFVIGRTNFLPHSILTFKNARDDLVGQINVLPDHEHEGEINLPPTADFRRYLDEREEVDDPVLFFVDFLREHFNLTQNQGFDALLNNPLPVLNDQDRELMGRLSQFAFLENYRQFYKEFNPRDYPKYNDYRLYWEVLAFSRSTNEKLSSNGLIDLSLREYGVVGAYNGHIVNDNCTPNEGVGRIVVDSTFHHWLDVNLIGLFRRGSDIQPRAFVDKRKLLGFRTEEGRITLNKILTYQRNIAIWTAPPEVQKEMAIKALWGSFFEEEITEVSYPLSRGPNNTDRYLEIGTIGIKLISRLVGEVHVRQWWTYILNREKVLKLLAPEIRANSAFIDEFLIGGILIVMGKRFNYLPANKLQRGNKLGAKYSRLESHAWVGVHRGLFHYKKFVERNENLYGSILDVLNRL